MKPTLTFLKKSMFIFLILTLSTFSLSCNKDELFIEDIEQIEETPSMEDIADDNRNVNAACDFTLNNLEANSTVIINCELNLNEQSINLPANVTIQYEGGKIINGTIVFSEGSIISGELLNSSLIISGVVPQLKDTFFNFLPSSWGIVEGSVSDEQALNNRNILQKIIDQTKLMGMTVFNIDALDAYFRVDLNFGGRDGNDIAAINIPSDVHLKMSDDTFLRVQPNKSPWYTLIKVRTVDNVIISGGHLVGDRFAHNYEPFTDRHGYNRDTHEFGALLYIIGSENIEVDNVHFSDPTGDAIMFHGEGLRQNDGTLMPGKREVNNVIVKNCTILRARRNGISFLDGRNITIDNCIISDTGLGEQLYDAGGKIKRSSAGVAPMYGIDLEAIRHRAADGGLLKTALNEDIIIKNSTFTGNNVGDIVVFTANDVIIENNFFDSAVRSFAAHSVTVRNNTFKSRDPFENTAISISSFVTFQHEEDTQGKELNHHWQVYNNTIKEYAKGFTIKGQNHEIKNNSVENCTVGVFLVNDLLDSTFSENTIISNLSNSIGYRNIINAQNINNVTISNETISVQNKAISLSDFLTESTLNTSQVSFKNCNFKTSNPNFENLIRRSKNVTFDGNVSNTKFNVIESENIILINNTFNN